MRAGITSSSFDDALKVRRVFLEQGKILGLPSSVAVSGFALAGGLFFLVKWWYGLLVAPVYFLSAYRIHRIDPDAHKMFLLTLTLPHYFRGRDASRLNITFVDHP